MPERSFEELLEAIRAEVARAFAVVARREKTAHGDDLQMVGLSTSYDGAQFLYPVISLRATAEETETPEEGMLGSLVEYEEAEGEGCETLDQLMEEIYEYTKGWYGHYNQFMEAVLTGMKESDAARFLNDDDLEKCTLAALIMQGHEWGLKHMVARLNSETLAERLFPTPNVLKESQVAPVGEPCSTWETHWNCRFAGRKHERIYATSWNDIFAFDLQTQQVTKVGESDINGLQYSAVTQDGVHLLATSSFAVEQWRLDHLERTWKLEVDFQPQQSGISPDETLAVIGAFQGPARIVDLRERTLIRSLSHDMEKEQVMGAAWHQDGARVATSCRDGTVRIWDTRSWELLEEISRGGDWVDFVPNQDLIAVAGGYSQDRGFRLWDLEEKNWLDLDVGERALRATFRADGELVVVNSSLFQTNGTKLAELDLEVIDACFLGDHTILFSWNGLHEPEPPFLLWQFEDA